MQYSSTLLWCIGKCGCIFNSWLGVYVCLFVCVWVCEWVSEWVCVCVCGAELTETEDGVLTPKRVGEILI